MTTPKDFDRLWDLIIPEYKRKNQGILLDGGICIILEALEDINARTRRMEEQVDRLYYGSNGHRRIFEENRE